MPFARMPIVQIGYVRVSANDQNTDLQRNALNCAGCELIFEDKIRIGALERSVQKKFAMNIKDGDVALYGENVIMRKITY